MAYTSMKELFKGICDAIRTKDGTAGTIAHQNIPDRILDITTGDGLDTSDATATSEDILSGKTAYANGEKITGDIEYTSGTKTLTGSSVTTDGSNLISAKNICVTSNINTPMAVLKGGKVKIDSEIGNFGDAAADDVLEGKTFTSSAGLKVTGTRKTTDGGIDTSDATATASDIAKNKTAYVNGEKVTGNVSVYGFNANNIGVEFEDGYIKYINNGVSRFMVDKGGAIGKSASSFGDATASDVAKGKTFTSAAGLLVTGTKESAATGNYTLQEKTVTPSESAQAVTPDSAYYGLSKVYVGAINKTYVGSGVSKKSAATYTPTTSDQTIAEGQYLSGKQTIKGDTNLLAKNIKKGVSIFNVAGTYEAAATGGVDTSDATATADDVLKGKTAYVNGAKVTGTLQYPTGNGETVYSSDVRWYSSNGVLPQQNVIVTHTFDEAIAFLKGKKIEVNVSAATFGDATAADVAKGKTFTSSTGLKVTGTYEPTGTSGTSNDNNNEAYHITSASDVLNFKRTDGTIKVWGYGLKSTSSYSRTTYSFVGDGYYSGTSYGTPTKTSATFSINSDGTLSGLPDGLTDLDILVTKGV